MSTIRTLYAAFLSSGLASATRTFPHFLTFVVLPALVNGEDTLTEYERETAVVAVASYLLADTVRHHERTLTGAAFVRA